jgi:XTP/dITP diphosphohydrolase
LKQIDFSKVYLGSSSQGKLDEYKSFGLPLKQTSLPDAPEVQGSDQEVITYKALTFGENFLVEDTSLQVEGEEVGVNIKWLIKELHNNPKFHHKKATWVVYLGLIQNGFLYLATGHVSGTIDITRKDKSAFGFDSVFIPDGSDKTLWELKQLKAKTPFSARKIAIDHMLNHEFDTVVEVINIPPWTGVYQK